MSTVALIGADGTGKTTLGRRLEAEAPFRLKYLYMGINTEASNRALPTTRLLLWIRRSRGKVDSQGGPPDRERRKERSGGPLKRLLRGVKSGLRMANQLCEEWYRQCLAWYYQARGYLVLFDRHYYPDFYFHDIAGDRAGRPLLRRLHGFLLEHVYPKPHLVILLDAPASVLFARKAEGTLELVERRRQEYLRLLDRMPRCLVVNSDQPPDAVAQEVIGHLCELVGKRALAPGGRRGVPAGGP